jgi:hypothetical protein
MLAIYRFSSIIELFSISKGCYRFSDGSFMKYFNYNETKPKLVRISAPIFKENDRRCYVWNKFKFIQNGQEWKDRRGNLFYIKDDTKELKVNRNGSPIKLFNKSTDQYTMVMQMSKCRHYGKTDIYCSNA